MNDLKTIKQAFATGTPPDGADAKAFSKLLKKYEHIVNPHFVHLYPIRDCAYEDRTYRVFRIPVNSSEIDNETLEAIKEEIASLPVGCVRFNGAGVGCRNVIFDPTTGNYEESDKDAVMEICSRTLKTHLFSENQ